MRAKLTLLLLVTHGLALAVGTLSAGTAETLRATAAQVGLPGPVLGAVTAAILVALTALLAVLVAAQLARRLVEPLADVVALVDRIAAERDYAARIEREHGASVAQPLVAALQRLLRQVEKEQRDQARVRDRLEQQLSARTVELSQRAKVEERIRHLAYYDVLTDLPNRQLLKDRLGKALGEVRTSEERLAVLYIDLDRFKNVNDTFGHGEGDHLLRIVAKRLLHCVREQDVVGPGRDARASDPTVSRQGGDEFTIVLPHVRDRSEVARIAERVSRVLAAPIELGGKEVVVGASVGIAIYPDDGRDADELLKHSDMAMYAAKESGRNRFVFFARAMKAAVLRKRALEDELRHALEWDELRVHYQPKVALATGRVVGLEALARWLQPGRGEVSPSEFVPLAEELGLVSVLGEWVLRRACEQTRTWLDAGRAVLPVAVNVSSLQFRDAELLDRVRAILARTGLPPRLLELEITESAMIENPTEVVRALEELRSVGVRVALDDFGTGYSSLVHVRKLPLDSVKIDASFVRGLPASTESASIVTAVVAMAHSLGIEVVAEGVERPEQAACLRDLGVDQIQGYLLCAALPPFEVEPLLGATFDVGAVVHAPASPGIGLEMAHGEAMEASSRFPVEGRTH